VNVHQLGLPVVYPSAHHRVCLGCTHCAMRDPRMVTCAKQSLSCSSRFAASTGYEGGKHQGGWGTENVIIPLGQGYLEIAAVFDPVAAQTCDWGKCVSAVSMAAPICPSSRSRPSRHSYWNYTAHTVSVGRDA
jgi:hypothetical protein